MLYLYVKTFPREQHFLMLSDGCKVGRVNGDGMKIDTHADRDAQTLEDVAIPWEAAAASLSSRTRRLTERVTQKISPLGAQKSMAKIRLSPLTHLAQKKIKTAFFIIYLSKRLSSALRRKSSTNKLNCSIPIGATLWLFLAFPSSIPLKLCENVCVLSAV